MKNILKNGLFLGIISIFFQFLPVLAQNQDDVYDAPRQHKVKSVIESSEQVAQPADVVEDQVSSQENTNTTSVTTASDEDFNQTVSTGNSSSERSSYQDDEDDSYRSSYAQRINRFHRPDMGYDDYYSGYNNSYYNNFYDGFYDPWNSFSPGYSSVVYLSWGPSWWNYNPFSWNNYGSMYQYHIYTFQNPWAWNSFDNYGWGWNSPYCSSSYWWNSPAMYNNYYNYPSYCNNNYYGYNDYGYNKNVTYGPRGSTYGNSNKSGTYGQQPANTGINIVKTDKFETPPADINNQVYENEGFMQNNNGANIVKNPKTEFSTPDNQNMDTYQPAQYNTPKPKAQDADGFQQNTTPVYQVKPKTTTPQVNDVAPKQNYDKPQPKTYNYNSEPKQQYEVPKSNNNNYDKPKSNDTPPDNQSGIKVNKTTK